MYGQANLMLHFMLSFYALCAVTFTDLIKFTRAISFSNIRYILVFRDSIVCQF
jgi:hypothetical protein